MAETTCTGPNCQGHPHSPECRAEYARSLQSTRSEAMELDDKVYVAHAIAYFNGLETKAAKEMADGLLRFLNSHYRLVAQMGSKWLPIETAPRDGSLFVCWVSAVRYIEHDDGSFEEYDVSVPDLCSWRDGDAGYWDNTMDNIGDQSGVTHWMPLPEPPGGDDEHR